MAPWRVDILASGVSVALKFLDLMCLEILQEATAIHIGDKQEQVSWLEDACEGGGGGWEQLPGKRLRMLRGTGWQEREAGTSLIQEVDKTQEDQGQP